jgi:hypothetical protein
MIIFKEEDCEVAQQQRWQLFDITAFNRRIECETRDKQKSFAKCEINNVLYSNTDYAAVKHSKISDNNNSNYRCGSYGKLFSEF